MTEYKEPELSIVVLDFLKESETRLCLESIKRHVKFPVKVIYYHNGDGAEYPYQFFKEGLCDTLIQTRKNEGLGIGTRDTMNAVFSPYTISLQNDQFIGRDFTYDEFSALKELIENNPNIPSVSLAGAVCGNGVYSERCFFIKTSFYKWMEKNLPLGYFGAGPYHNGEWRESQIQKFYTKNYWSHYTAWPVLVVDNGVYAIREMGEGGIWLHRTDTKQLWCIVSPSKLNPVYPKFTQREAEMAINGSWPDGFIPETELAHSFRCWPQTQDEDFTYFKKLFNKYNIAQAGMQRNN